MTVILGLPRPRREVDVFLLLYHVYRPRGFYSFLDNFNIEMKSKMCDAVNQWVGKGGGLGPSMDRPVGIE